MCPDKVWNTYSLINAYVYLADTNTYLPKPRETRSRINRNIHIFINTYMPSETQIQTNTHAHTCMQTTTYTQKDWPVVSYIFQIVPSVTLHKTNQKFLLETISQVIMDASQEIKTVSFISMYYFLYALNAKAFSNFDLVIHILFSSVPLRTIVLDY